MNKTTINHSRTITLIGVLFLIILLVLNFLFYKERIAFTDLAFHMFTLIENGSLQLQNDRWIAAITQIWPVMLQNFDVSLETIAKVYSSSFVFVQLITALLLLFYFKNFRLLFVFLLFQVLISSESFFWDISELRQGVALFFIVLALIEQSVLSPSKNPYRIALIVSSQVFVAFAHPLLIFPVLYTAIFFILRDRKYIRLMALVIGVTLICSIVKATVMATPYESVSMGRVTNFTQYIDEFWGYESNFLFLQLLLTKYIFYTLISLGVVWYCVKEEKYIMLLLTVAFSFGLVGIINLTYPTGEFLFYLENQYLVLSIFVSFPFVYDVLTENKLPKNLPLMLMIACTVFALFRYADSHQTMKARYGYLQTIDTSITNSKTQKVILKPTQVDQSTLQMGWSLGYELWLLGMFENGIANSILLEDFLNEFQWVQGDAVYYRPRWGSYEYGLMNNTYFNFRNTTQSYQYNSALDFKATE